jgi:hypothetical protein
MVENAESREVAQTVRYPDSSVRSFPTGEETLPPMKAARWEAPCA